VIQTAPLIEARAVSDIHQRSILHSHAKVLSSQEKDQEKDSCQGWPSDTKTTKGHLQLVLDKDDNDYSSEAESFYGDSDMEDDHEREVGSESEGLISEVKVLVHHLLQSNGLGSFLSEIEGSSGAFNCCPVDGFTATRRQGSPIDGPPPKRRSIRRGKALQLPEGDGQSDNGEDSDERYGKNNEVKPRGSSRSARPFACPFHQRDRTRYTNRACQWPGWVEFPRLK